MWTYYVEVHSFSWHRTGDNDKDHPQEKEIKKKWLSEEALLIAVKRSETKGKGEKHCGEGGCCKLTLACAHSVSATLGLPPLKARVPSLPTLLRLWLLHWEPSEAGPGLHAPPRSKPLRSRHSGSPQRRGLGWACVLCTSQVRAAQVMRCLASAIAAIYRLPGPCGSVFWVYNPRTFSGEC